MCVECLEHGHRRLTDRDHVDGGRRCQQPVQFGCAEGAAKEVARFGAENGGADDSSEVVTKYGEVQ